MCGGPRLSLVFWPQSPVPGGPWVSMWCVCSMLAEGGAGLFSDWCSLLFHQVVKALYEELGVGGTFAWAAPPPILLSGSGSLPTLSLSLHLFLLASGQDCGVQVRGTCLLRCAAPSHCQSFCKPPSCCLRSLQIPPCCLSFLKPTPSLLETPSCDLRTLKNFSEA